MYIENLYASGVKKVLEEEGLPDGSFKGENTHRQILTFLRYSKMSDTFKDELTEILESNNIR